MTSLKPGGRITILFAFVLAGLVLVGLGVSAPSLWRKASVGTSRENVAQEPIGRPAIPPIDGASPADFETATFALG